MRKKIQFTLTPEEAYTDRPLEEVLHNKFSLKSGGAILPLRRSIDARTNPVKIRVAAEYYHDENPPSLINHTLCLRDVSRSPRVIIVGSGPAGLFAALKLIELGVKPVILERGKDVRSRRRDLAAINKNHTVNPDSNYCFGEGGAGTYSDGKLYTRSKKRGDVKRILDILVAHGASHDILIDAHPHIGTNKLPKIIMAIRESILSSGGEVHFETRVDDLIISNGEAVGVRTSKGESFHGEAVILATGHSARDIFNLLHSKQIQIEVKPFALGVRVEHPQSLIDRIQYHCEQGRGEYLPAAAYSLAHQAVVAGRQLGVFSFCMCPGGFIVPSATAPGEVVVNGMSPSRRDSKFANSGIVVSVEEADFQDFRKFGPLAGVYFQSQLERLACELAGGKQTAPAQRLMDFVGGKTSSSLPATSYQPGLISASLDEVLPKQLAESLRSGFKAFGKKMKGFLTNEAQVVGVESRTSSPVRIPRDREKLEHPGLKRLFPCGEGAGYAGGIVSAAMDGERCAAIAAAQYAGKIDV